MVSPVSIVPLYLTEGSYRQYPSCPTTHSFYITRRTTYNVTLECFFFAVVDNVTVPRQPNLRVSGIYFITPTAASVKALIADYQKKPQHFKAHIFFSSAVDPSLLQLIRGCSKLVDRLATLKEVNVEFLLYPDNRSFTTGQEMALPGFFSSGVDASDEYRAEITTMATRLATLFATLKEYPAIRFRAATPPGDEFPPGLESRLLVSQRLAVELYEALADMQRAGHVPERETCELVITDRGFDPVAPVIHEWTYEAMTHDLMENTPQLKGKVFTFDSESQSGKMEPKDHILDERDEMHMELRHLHFAAASLRISNAMDNIRTQSKVASRGRKLGEMDLKGMSKLVQALPQYRDQLANLSAHVELASLLNRAIDSRKLPELGKIEQDLVYGDATSKEVISWLSTNQLLPEEDKLRMLMCYSATHQEKLDPTRATQWQKVARLSHQSMSAITNLEYLGVPVCKRQKGTLAGALSFGRRRRRTIRKDREADEDESQYALSRFVPLLSEVLEDASAGKLSIEEYPYVRPPGSPSGSAGAQTPMSDAGGDGDGTPSASGVTSFRTLRSTGNWAKKAGSSGGSMSEPTRVATELVRNGGRTVAFVIGGFTFSELRVVHRLTARTGRDFLLGGTSVQTPAKFINQVVSLGVEQEAVRALEIEQPKGVSVRRK